MIIIIITICCVTKFVFLYRFILDTMTDHMNTTGNDFYRKGQFEEAVACYKDALSVERDKEKPDQSALINLHNNSAQCFLKLKKYEDAVEEASQCMYIICVDVVYI